ncbi:MAG: HNH endonuclease [Proteobacteria bacterium]|nr:HNH endonuclease [Pseudomonadota bacterium]
MVGITPKRWTKDELVLALNLYCKLPFGRMHRGNPDIIALADYLNRTPSSVAMKLVNFAALDPSLPRKGLSGTSKLDQEVWNEFFNNEDLLLESEKSISSIYTHNEYLLNDFDTRDYHSTDRLTETKARCLQGFFRTSVLINYHHKCCLSGINVPQLLIASHIVPWSTDVNNRLNPSNGICLNALYDKAFDRGLITFDNNYCAVISSTVENSESNRLIFEIRGKQLEFPEKFYPSQEFLEYHRNNIFVQ